MRVEVVKGQWWGCHHHEGRGSEGGSGGDVIIMRVEAVKGAVVGMSSS